MSLTSFSSQLIADVGISLGDEGKGRLIPEVIAELRGSAHPVSTVVKVNGGANAGHTAGGIKLSLLPAGVITDVPHLGIGSGVVADPRKFWWEIRPLEKKGYAILSRLQIDERTLVSDLTHRLLDLAWEDYRAEILHEEPRGSTGRGITPSYQDEVGQWPIYFTDFRSSREDYVRNLPGDMAGFVSVPGRLSQDLSLPVALATQDSFVRYLGVLHGEKANKKEQRRSETTTEEVD